jgi:hypothetical protein
MTVTHVRSDIQAKYPLTGAGGLTEEQLERELERLTNRIDARFMSLNVDQADYDQHIVALNNWHEYQLARLSKGDA